MRAALVRTLLIPTLALGCSGEESTAPPVAELEAAPTTQVVANTTLELETTLWRDFMPISPPDGRPLIAVLRVRTTDESALPQGLSVEAAHVIHGEDVWSAAPREEHGSERDDVLEVVLREGPKWGPGVTVDVVVEIQHAGRLLLLRAPEQPIIRTD